MGTKTYILKCPHCGAEKKITFSAHLLPNSEYTYWSDGRVESEGWLETIRTHQCPSCGKFYVFSQASILHEVNDPGDDNGQLSYNTLKQAIIELSGDEYAESWARLEAWRAYNALYQYVTEIPAEEQVFNRANMKWLLEFFTARSTWFSFLVFELNRMLGNRTVCEQMIEAFTYASFIGKTKARDQEKGIQREYNNDLMKSRYANQLADLKYALTQPLKTYNVNDKKV